MPDQFCEQFFEQNIDFPAEKKLLAKCEQNIEILMKIDPKASQPGVSREIQSLFLATYCTVRALRRGVGDGADLPVAD